MNPVEHSELHAALRSRCEAIADNWFKAIVPTGFASQNKTEARRRLGELAEQAITVLLADPLDRDHARDIGGSLACLHYVQPETLGRTLEVLACQLTEGLSPGQLAALQPRLPVLLGELSTGFSSRAREAVLTEQEQIRAAFVAELEGTEQELRRHHLHLEELVEERTAELTEAIEQLQREVTERTRIEVALRETERRFGAFMDNLPGIAFMKDAEGHYLYGNETFKKLYGLEIEEWQGKGDDDLWPADTAEQLKANDHLVMTEGRKLETIEEIPQEDGIHYWLTIKFPIWNADRRPAILAGIAMDITKRVRAEEELRQYQDHLEELVEERTAELTKANQQLQQEIVERKRADGALLRAEAELSTLLESTQVVSSTLNLEEVLALIAEQMVRIVGVDGCALCRWDQEMDAVTTWIEWPRQDSESADGPGTMRALDDFPPTRAVLDTRQPLVVHISDPNAHPAEIAQLRKTRSASMLKLPLAVGDRVLGLIELSQREYERDLTADEMRLCRALADQAAVAIENARLYQGAQQRARELATLNKTSQLIASSLDLNEVLKQAMAEARAMLGVEAASVILHDVESDELVFAAAASPAAEVLVGARMPAAAGIAGWTMQKGQPALVRDTRSDPRFYDRFDALTGLDTHTLIAMPLQYKGVAIGVIEAINKISGPFNEHDLDLLTALANSTAIAIVNARLYEAEREQRRLVEQSQAQLIHTEKMAALGRLAASIAHEINNPLQAVLGCMRLAEDELQGRFRREKLERHLSVASAETRRISAILRRMHDFYRRAREELQPTDVHAILESVLNLSAKQLQHSGVIVERDWTDGLPVIQGNPDHLRQVFLNLLINALDAMPQGGRLRIGTALEEPDSWENGRSIRVEFSDTGAGMPPEVQARLFEPFFTTKEDGTGLGLSITYGIIESHNGQITASSQEGEGTTFTILLPVD